MGPGASPGAIPFLPSVFCGKGCGVLLRSAARRACVLLSCRVGRVFLGGAPGGVAGVSGGCSAFFLRVAFAHVVMFVFACATVSLCGALRGFESPVRALGRLRRASPREARTARFSWAFGSYGGRLVLRGFCGGAIFLLSWLCPWLVARLQGRVFLSSGL